VNRVFVNQSRTHDHALLGKQQRIPKPGKHNRTALLAIDGLLHARPTSAQ
jgi:hypothetical protein